MEFEELGLHDEFVKVLRGMKFTNPTDIQASAIPLTMQGKDIIGGSATGSGKTLAFGASIIEHAKKGAGLQALILTPTRELAEQVSKSLAAFSAWKKLNVAVAYGGVGIEPQIWAIKKAEILVGTPGRILDHLERNTLDLSEVKYLVLDEADKMLDMGFIDDVTQIIKQCKNPTRQTMLFSATISQDISRLSKMYMKHPQEIALENQVDPTKLKQVYYDVESGVKFSLLVHLLKNEEAGLVMVFCNTRRNTDIVTDNLSRNGIEAVAIHGGLTQARRNKIMEHFKQNRVFVMVCTDVAARGLDIKGVSHVYNYDLPNSSKEYVHRIGRTARAGKEGIAISLVSGRDYENFRNILRDEEIRINEVEVPKLEKVFFAAARGRGFGGDRREGFRGGDRRGNRGESRGRSYRGGDRGEGRERRSFGRNDRGRNQRPRRF